VTTIGAVKLISKGCVAKPIDECGSDGETYCCSYPGCNEDEDNPGDDPPDDWEDPEPPEDDDDEDPEEFEPPPQPDCSIGDIFDQATLLVEHVATSLLEITVEKDAICA
jgi:hypothetical protein